MDFEPSNCQPEKGSDELSLPDILEMRPNSQTDEMIASWDLSFRQSNNIALDYEMQMLPTFSDDLVQHDSPHGDSTDAGFSTSPLQLYNQAIQDYEMLDSSVLQESNMLQESNEPSELDSMIHAVPPRLENTSFESSVPLEMGITAHDLPLTAESDRMMFQEFTNDLVPPANQSAIGFAESQPHDEINHNIHSHDQGIPYIVEGAKQNNCTRQIQGRSLIRFETPIPENSSQDSSAHMPILNSEPIIKPDARKKNLQPLSTSRKPSRATKLDKLLGGCYRVQTFRSTSRSRTKYDRQNNLAVRKQGGQCLRCIYYRRKCSPFSPGLPCQNCQGVSRNREIECVGADIESFNFFAWGGHDISSSFGSSKFNAIRHRPLVDTIFLLCSRDAFAWHCEKPDESKLLQFHMTTFFKASKAGEPLSFCLGIWREISPFGALTIFTIYSLLLLDKNKLLAYTQTDQRFLKSCRAYCSTLLLTLVDQLVRGKSVSPSQANNIYFCFYVVVNVVQDTLRLVKGNKDMSSSQAERALYFMEIYLAESMNLLQSRFKPLVSHFYDPFKARSEQTASVSDESSISGNGPEEPYQYGAETLSNRLDQLKIGEIAAMLPPSWLEVSDRPEHSTIDPVSLLCRIVLQNVPLNTAKLSYAFAQKWHKFVSVIVRLMEFTSHIIDRVPRFQAYIHPMISSQQKDQESDDLRPVMEYVTSAFRDSGEVISFDTMGNSLDRRTIFTLSTTLSCILFMLNRLDILDTSELNTTLGLLWETKMYGMASEFFLKDPLGLRTLSVFETRVEKLQPDLDHMTANKTNGIRAKRYESYEDAFMDAKKADDISERIYAGLTRLISDLLEAVDRSVTLYKDQQLSKTQGNSDN